MTHQHGSASLRLCTQSLPSTPWYFTYSGALLLYLYVSRFVPDVVLCAVALAFLVQGSLSFSRKGLLTAAIFCVFVVLQVALVNGRVEDPAQLVHLIFLLPLAIALNDRSFCSGTLVAFCRATTWLNVALLLLLFVPPLRDMAFWGADRGVLRYQSILPEPSFVGLYSALNFFVLLRGGQRGMAYLNVLPLLASFSLAGVVAFAFLSLYFARSVWREALIGVLVLAIGMLLFFFLQPDQFSLTIASRVLDLMAGGRDESVTLRIFAPVDLITHSLTGPSLQTLFGLGLGNVEHFIYFEQSTLDQHWRSSGERSPQPDSVIAFVLASFGLVGLAFLLFGLCWLFLRQPRFGGYDVLPPFVLVVALFTGLFVSFHLWAWVYLLRHQELSFEDSSASTPAAVSPG
jgi:hypothetical protein